MGARAVVHVDVAFVDDREALAGDGRQVPAGTSKHFRLPGVSMLQDRAGSTWRWIGWPHIPWSVPHGGKEMRTAIACGTAVPIMYCMRCDVVRT
jgi:hypothetical protein